MRTIIERRRSGAWYHVAVVGAGIIFYVSLLLELLLIISGVRSAFFGHDLGGSWFDYFGFLAILAWVTLGLHRAIQYCEKRSSDAWVPVREAGYRVRRVR